MLELLETPLTVLHIVVCFFLVLVVLIQPGKSGGLGAAFGGAGATQVFGGRGAGNFLSKTTWICASLFFVTSMTLAYISSSTDDSLAERANQADVQKVDLPKADPARAAGANAADPGAAGGADPASDLQQAAAAAASVLGLSAEMPASPAPAESAPQE
jgi:preprotein translocase subunit SecG